MELSPGERKRIYEEEKAKVEAEAAGTGDSPRAGSRATKSRGKKTPTWQLIVAAPAGLVVLLVVIGVVGALVEHGNPGSGLPPGSSSPTLQRTQPSRTASLAAEPSPRFAP
ncbi:MAG TPA: hypothetical protein VKV79_02030, partial [Terriglobia bacterium]|nr:hypothetical protein [Terriglobia bacterium]